MWRYSRRSTRRRNGTPVDDKDYQVPFTFTGKLHKLTLSIDRPKLTPEDEKRLMEEGQRSNKKSE